jgi:hypothetical protein
MYQQQQTHRLCLFAESSVGWDVSFNFHISTTALSKGYPRLIVLAILQLCSHLEQAVDRIIN